MRNYRLVSIVVHGTAFALVTFVPGSVSAQARANPDDRAQARVPAAPAASAVQGYLKIDGIDGESTARGHENWIEIESFSAGGARASAGQAVLTSQGPGSITLVARLAKSSPKLTEACTQGRSLGRVILHLRAADGARYDEYVLDETAVSACSQGSSSDRPSENITLNFGKVESPAPGGNPDRPVVIGR
jgi:type VI secretion system secreted protein Hcp